MDTGREDPVGDETDGLSLRMAVVVETRTRRIDVYHPPSWTRHPESRRPKVGTHGRRDLAHGVDGGRS